MSNAPVLTLALSALAALALLAAAPPSAPGSAAPASAAALGPLPVEANWKARAEAWFGDAKDERARRKAMRQVTRAIKQPCRYCHTPDWKGYTDKLGISRQMMAMSAEHDVACADCHAGKTEMTELGKVAQTMWAVAHDQKVDCTHCHVPKAKFKTLTDAGKAYKAKQPK